MKHFKTRIIFFVVMLTVVFATSALAYLPNWYQEGNNWKIKDGSGNVITNAWVCDDTDGTKPWYLLDANGNMLTGLVQDNGLWYLLGSNGSLYFNSGYYSDVYLDISSSGAIKNLDSVMLLGLKYGGCSAANSHQSIYLSSFSKSQSSQSSFQSLYIPEFELEYDDMTWEKYKSMKDEIHQIAKPRWEAAYQGAGKLLDITPGGEFEVFTNADMRDKEALDTNRAIPFVQQVLAEFNATGVQFTEDTNFEYSYPGYKVAVWTWPSGSQLWILPDDSTFSFKFSNQTSLYGAVATPYNLKKAIYKILKSTA